MESLLQTILDILVETQNIEFKRLEGPKTVAKIIETIVAMTNTDGGWLIIGVDDPEKTTKKGVDRVYGIEENKELFDEIGRKVQNIIPPIVLQRPPELILEEKSGNHIALIRIEKSTEQFHSTPSGGVYQRLTKGNKKLNPQEIIKLSYAKGFKKADRELVEVDFSLLETKYYESRKKQRKIDGDTIQEVFFKTGLAKKQGDTLLPTRASVLLFAEYPTNLMETKCTIRIYKYQGTIEQFREKPNLVETPKTIEGPIIELIDKTHEYVLTLIASGIEIHSGFITKYKIPVRAIKEAITNAVIHRDYNIKRDIEIKAFEDRIEILSPGLFIGNITKQNIGTIRADEYRNDLLVKHLREFPTPPNLDRNEGIQAMRHEMNSHNLYPPIFITYPTYEDSINVVLLNELRPTEWENVKQYLESNKYINSTKAREITGIKQRDTMSRFFKKRVDNDLLIRVGEKRRAKYKLSNREDLKK